MTAEPAASHASKTKQKVWDGPTRLAHWLFVALVAFSWWCAENRQMDWHLWSGLTVLGVLVFRIYWGFAGPETARFSRFVKGPQAIGAYVGRLVRPDYRAVFGHNPLGALSVVAILLALATQVGLGLFASDTDGLYSGPLSRFVDYDTSVVAGHLHHTSFNMLLVLIGLHVAAIAFYLVVKRINLTGPMVTGSRKAGDGEAPPAGITRAPLWRFALGLVIAAGVVWLIVL